MKNFQQSKMIKTIQYYGFQILKIIFSLINWLLVVKTNGALDTSKVYETSARVSKVFGRFKYHYGPFTRSNFDFGFFLYLHERFDHPNIVLSDNVSLYTITKDEAIFVDCGEFDLFANDPVSLILAQEREALKLITLPIDSFNLLANQIPVAKAKFVHIANHGRCGSTLMQKIIMQVPNTLTISGPHAPVAITEFSRLGIFNDHELRAMTSSTVKYYMKHANCRNSEIICLEDWSISIFMLDILFDAWPPMKHIYLFRQPVPFTRSWEKLQIIHQWYDISMYMFKNRRGIGHKILSHCPTYDDAFMQDLSPFGKLALFWIAYNAVYKRIVSKGYPIVSVKFEDFIKKPKEVMLQIFKYFEIPAERLPDVNQILSTDSQSGSFLTSQNANHNELEKKLTPLNEDVKREVDMMCEDYNVPLFWDDDIYLENNINKFI